MKKLQLLIFALLLSITACSQAAEKTPSQEPSELPTEMAVDPTNTIPQTSTEVPPTNTPIPSNTPELTVTPTPIPSDTPTVTPTFSPETLNFAAGEPLKIGYLLWETHPLGIDTKRGIEIAIKDFGGELFGHPIELTGFDSECNELAAQRGSQILVRDDSVIGILGTVCSRGALRAAPIVSDGNRVMISPSNTSPELTAPDSHSAGYFRTAPNDILQVIAAAQYAYNELGARRLATVYAATEKVQKLQSDFLCEAFTDLGGECVLERTMENGSTYMEPIVNSLVEAAPDAIYFMGWGFEEGAAFITKVRATPGFERVPLFFWEIYNNPGFLQQAGENALGVYVSTTSYDFDHEADIYQIFLNAYRSTYGEEPVSTFHPYAYDAATLLLKAIAQTAVQAEDGSLMGDPFAVRDALHGMEGFHGLTGLISCSTFGDCANITEGKVFEFTSGDPTTFNPGPADLLSSNPSQVWP
jgi:branched-chain amino acid transport system substrate-binding protein